MIVPGLTELEKICVDRARWHWHALGQLYDASHALELCEQNPSDFHIKQFEDMLDGFDYYMRMDRHHHTQGEDHAPKFIAVADWMRAYAETLRIAAPIIEAANRIRGYHND